MGLRMDELYCGQYQHVTHTTQAQTGPPVHTAQASRAPDLSRGPSSEGSSTASQTQSQIPAATGTLRQADPNPPGHPSTEIERTAQRVERVARENMGIDMPAGWRTGGLDDLGRSPMDRWLGGSDGTPGYSPRPGAG